MANTPLDTFFGIPPREDGEYAPELFEIEISDNPDLAEITKLALQAYKEQMENVQHIEPKYRQRYLEVAQQYLSLAKDALAKQEELKQKREKLDSDLNKKDKPEESQITGMTRKALLEVVKNSK
jgi:hypothetical protein